jgi:23S rRNA (uracil1939-C5)-methyltransferase
VTCARTGRRPPETVRLTIDSLAFGGDGVGRDDDGRVVFVPGTAPGDEVVATIVEQKKGFARADLARVVRPGARVAPSCPRFDAGCGGCQWQHVALAAQRAAKADIVARALRHVVPPEAIRAMATPSPPLGWRRRARLRFRRGAVGYLARRSHELVDVDTCPQLEPSVDAALAAIRGVALAGAGDIELLVTRRGEVHVAVDGPEVRAADLAPLLGRAGIVGIGARGETLGAAEVDLGDGDAPFWATADAFAQASAAGNDLLRALVREAAGPTAGARVLELYAGSGNFTRDFVGADVVAVEESAAAAARLPRNARADVRAEPAHVPAGPFDVVVVDPPRTGLAPGLAAKLAALAAPRLVYVSCDPPTLARDLAPLRAAGYRPAWAQPIDLMPQTFHVEVVVALARASG